MWINPTYTELSLGRDWEAAGTILGSNRNRTGKRPGNSTVLYKKDPADCGFRMGFVFCYSMYANHQPLPMPLFSTLSERIRFYTLLLGVIQITVGCLVGLIPPDAIAWYRGLVMAHIQFTANGVLLVVLGFLLREMALSAFQLRCWFISTQLGTWLNGVAGMIAAIIGQSSSQMPALNKAYPPPTAGSSALVYTTLVLCGLLILLGLGLTIWGLVRGRQLDHV